MNYVTGDEYSSYMYGIPAPGKVEAIQKAIQEANQRANAAFATKWGCATYEEAVQKEEAALVKKMGTNTYEEALNRARIRGGWGECPYMEVTTAGTIRAGDQV